MSRSVLYSWKPKFSKTEQIKPNQIFDLDQMPTLGRGWEFHDHSLKLLYSHPVLDHLVLFAALRPSPDKSSWGFLGTQGAFLT